jgi:16S rRNA (cytosine1402-N4)-methyltransferase
MAASGPAPSFTSVAKPLFPSDRELARNPRARSARLRTAVRTDAPAWDQEKAA